MSRRKGRILAFQVLFSWEATKSSLDDLLNFSWLQKDSEFTANPETEVAVAEVKESSKEEQTFASLIASGTVDHISEIDDMIKAHLTKDWSLERINKVTLAILRTSIYEMKFQAGSTPQIVIDEAVKIAKDFGTDDSYKFINAVLDKIGKDEAKKS
ncbi:transcription antitermination factor NusB [Treponema sp. JC4]|uniref:transcription antitermination factor NusB n=1 Tax=Treponema sp. JC4 TaxID=1124982 RepID=UPI00025B0C0B|nr:transcription antitermination factor NusB [Treponema sp. JC4]EID85588.1 transcription antitermination factor NusB [Treponema sp. JC4]